MYVAAVAIQIYGDMCAAMFLDYKRDSRSKGCSDPSAEAVPPSLR
jgi:hypothetical protein